MICTSEHGNPNKIRLFSTLANMSPIMTTHLKSQWDMTEQITKLVPFQEPYWRIPQRSSPTETKYATELIRITIRSLMRKLNRNSWTLLMLIPAAQKMIYATILNRIVMTNTDIKLQIRFGMAPGTTTYTIRGLWEGATENLRSRYIPNHKTHSITSGTLLNW